MGEVSNETVMKNLIWRYCERFLAQIITFVVSLVLVRIVAPEAYGTIAIVLAVVNMLEVFSTRGFNLALIQKKDIYRIDYSSIFIVNLLIECILYAIVFLAAPFIASFYSNQELSTLIRVVSVKLIINGANSVQQAYVQRNMLYKKFFFSTLIGTIVSGVAGVILAINGLGAWALVWQILINVCMDTFILFLTIDWKPHLEFSMTSVKGMMPYGMSMFGQGILESIYSQVRTLGIGKVYSTSELAFYDKGQHIPTLVLSNIQAAAGNVFFSALSRENSYGAVKKKMRQYLGIMFYLVAPMMTGLAVVSKSVISIFYTDKWLGATPYMVIYCFYYLTWIIQIPISQAINSRGLVKESFMITLCHRINSIILMVVSLKMGSIYVALTALLADIEISIFLLWYANRHFDYRIIEIINDLAPTIVYSIIMAGMVYFVGCLTLQANVVVRLIIQVFSGIMVYVGLSVITKNVYFDKIKKWVRKDR